MSESDLGKYCRENGLYASEVKEWRSNCIAANDGFASIDAARDWVSNFVNSY